jgi:hypothetical protein
MQNVMEADPEKLKRVKWIKQKEINAYRDYPSICSPEKEKDFPIWTPGDLVIHFPGHSKWDGFPKMLQEYNSKVTGLDDIDAA